MESAYDSCSSQAGAATPQPVSDRVVRELDVCLSSGVLGSDTKVSEAVASRYCDFI